MFYFKAIPVLFVSLLAQNSIAQNMLLPEFIGVTNTQATSINTNKSPILVNNPVTQTTKNPLPQLSAVPLNQNSYKSSPEMIGVNPTNYKPLQKIAVPQLVNKSEVPMTTNNQQHSLGKPLHIDGRNQKTK